MAILIMFKKIVCELIIIFIYMDTTANKQHTLMRIVFM